jgi:hypothetical protein
MRSLPPGWEWAPFADVAGVDSDLVDPADYLYLPHIAPNHIESRTGKLLPYGTVRDDGVTSSKHLTDEYISWEYASGYLYGLADAGVPVLQLDKTMAGACPFCGVDLLESGDRAIYCPTCGTHLGPARIAAELSRRGWTMDEVNDLLRGARVPPLRGLPEP